MKTIGVIGGLSPESSVYYYNALNAGAKARLGGHHNARILMASLDFGVFVALKEKGDWDSQSELLCEAARDLERGGADFVILATNTMHKMAPQIEVALEVPFLHIADATAREIQKCGLSKVALLGTRYTMELDFYKGRLRDQGIDAIVPDEAGRGRVHDIIYDELCQGVVDSGSRDVYLKIIDDLRHAGAQGVIYGCTEIGLLMEGVDVGMPVFDTALIHVEAALDGAFS